MADRTQENLARIRACDADWNESDHPRADNGQFTSGSGGGGAKVSKLQSGGKAKVQQLKNVSGALAGVNAAAEKATNTYQAQRLSNLAREDKARAKIQSEIEQNKTDHKNDWRYGEMYGRLKNAGHGALAERVREKGEGKMKEYSDRYDQLMQKKQAAAKEYGEFGSRNTAARRKADAELNRLYPQKQALEAEQKKFQGAKKTLENAKPGIAKMREQADNERQGTPEDKNWVRRKLGKEKYDDLMEKTRRKPGYVDRINNMSGAELRKLVTPKPGAQPAAKPAQKSNDLQPAPIAKPTRNASPEQAAAKFNEIASAYKRLDTDVAKYARQAAKVAAKGGEAAAAAWLDKTIAKIDSDPEAIPFVKGYHRGRLRMLMEQYNK